MNNTNPLAPMIVWFSCGAASAVAAKLAIGKYRDKRKLEVICCDTRPSEHPDNYRFSEEVEKWIGQPVIYIKSDAYVNVDEVFSRTKYMAGVLGARCTTELKKIPRLRYAPVDAVHVWGFTVEEKKRIRDFKQNNPDMFCEFILQDEGVTKSDCYQMIKDAGIELPAMYKLGFNNNNCPGCVKASSPWYWAMVRKHFPEVFKRR